MYDIIHCHLQIQASDLCTLNSLKKSVEVGSQVNYIIIAELLKVAASVCFNRSYKYRLKHLN